MTLDALRTQLRWQRTQHSPAQRQHFSQQATTHAMQLLADYTVNNVASFISLPEEIDTSFLNEALLQQAYAVYLPYVRASHQPLEWVAYRADSDLTRDKVGLMTADVNTEQTIPASALDAVITPLVGFDAIGNRLGMGGGYYDRSFAFKSRGQPPYLLGFAYACQQVNALPHAVWDIPLDGVITERGAVLFEI